MVALTGSLPTSRRIADAGEGHAQTSEEDAWIVAARHDPAAFAPLYERYALPVYRFCYRKVGDPEIANDLTSQIFIKAIERLDRYHPKPGATFRSWLFAIARNTIVDGWRRTRSTTALDPVARSLIDPGHSPEHHAIEGDSLAAMDRLLAMLPESQRAIVELRLAGLTTREIMHTLRMTEPAVKSAQHRAYLRLRDLVSREEGPSR